MSNAIMLIAIPIFFVLIFVEYLVAKRQHKEVYRLNDTIANLNIGIGNQVISVLSKGLIFGIIYWIYEHWAIWNIPVNVLSIFICFLLFDFIYYWAHRWGHKVNFFWGAHVVHHQSEEYNLSVALRQPWFHHLISFFLFLPLPLLGFNPLVIGGVSLFVTLYQFWIHTRTIKYMPRIIEFLFNTPAHHRVHHAINPDYIDKNHGAVLIIWDRIFGTFQAEKEEEVYGITTALETFSPVLANTHYYTDLWKMMKDLNWKQRIKLLFAPPGWQEGGRPVEELIKEVELDRAKYNPEVPLGFKAYAALQFVLILWGSVAYLSNFENLSLAHQVYFAALIILSLAICSGILESKKWVYFAEYSRLLLVGVSLNALYYFKYLDWFLVVLVASGIGLVLFYTWFSISLGKNYRELLLR
ncbi:MAG: sterol desaturase family protein [Chitinophagales bacterium]